MFNFFRLGDDPSYNCLVVELGSTKNMDSYCCKFAPADQLSNEKRAPCCLGYIFIGDETTQLNGDYFINYYKDPHETTSISWKVRLFCSWLSWYCWISIWRTIQTRRLILPYGLDPQKEHGQEATFCLDVQVENQISHVIYYVYVPGS